MIVTKIFLTIAVLAVVVLALIWITDDTERSKTKKNEELEKIIPIAGGLTIIIIFISLVIALIGFIWGI